MIKIKTPSPYEVEAAELFADLKIEFRAWHEEVERAVFNNVWGGCYTL